MKIVISTALTLTMAMPAFAHGSASFHTHGAELFLALAGLGAVAAMLWAARR